MARPARPRPVAPAPRAAVSVPPELLIGALAECWSDSGHESDLGSAWGNYGRARRAWCAEHRLDTHEQSLALPSGAPWALAVPAWMAESGRPYDDPADRLARLGLTPTDLPALRRAAQARIRSTDPSRRTT